MWKEIVTMWRYKCLPLLIDTGGGGGRVSEVDFSNLHFVVAKQVN